MTKIQVVVIGSPTATGKTRLAMELAQSADGEIINADSLQVYRYLDIGTAKPTRAEREKITHHLLDVVDPDGEFNAAIYAEKARAVIEKLAGEGKRVFVVGGTGLYIRALLRGILATPPIDHHVRNYYKDLRDRYGREHLYQLLSEKDPQAALRINPNDSVRVIRALEVFEQCGESLIALQKRHAFADCPYEVCKIGLCVERGELKKRIAARTEQMAREGLVEEVRGILARGYSETLKPLQSLGYRQVIEFIHGRYGWDRAIDLINRATWQYSKRQWTWFSADADIQWFAPDQFEKIRKIVEAFHAGRRTVR